MTTERYPQLATSFTVPQINRIPGYGGFCPTVRTNYGLTYGTATKTFYAADRRDILNTSTKPPTAAPPIRSSDGGGVVKSVIVSRQRPMSATAVGANPWNKPLPYSLHLEGHRRDNVLRFDTSAQTYRNFYKDHSGIVQTVPIIHQRAHSAPNVPNQQIADSAHVKLPQLQGVEQGYSRLKSAAGYKYTPPSRTGSAKERAVRNAFFEKR